VNTWTLEVDGTGWGGVGWGGRGVVGWVPNTQARLAPAVEVIDVDDSASCASTVVDGDLYTKLCTPTGKVHCAI
jgi:hypothetical protein